MCVCVIVTIITIFGTAMTNLSIAAGAPPLRLRADIKATRNPQPFNFLASPSFENNIGPGPRPEGNRPATPEPGFRDSIGLLLLGFMGLGL